MDNKEKLAMYILDMHIKEFYKKSPNARFDDIPNSVFIDAMVEYGQEVLKKTSYV